MTAPVETGLTPAQIATIIALVQAQAALRQQLRDAAVQAAVAAFSALPNWWDPARIDRAITQALRVIQPTQRQAARVTDAYLARVASTMLGRTVRPAGAVDVTRLRRQMTEKLIRELADGRREPAWVELGSTDDSRARRDDRGELRERLDDFVGDVEYALEELDRGRDRRTAFLDPREPYGRVADQHRRQVSIEGATEDVAGRKALVRIAAIAATDVTLAIREQWRKSGGSIPGITGWRRIVRPELSQNGPCGLCVVAADRKYKKEDLQPIHDNCVCEVLPIIGDRDPGLRLNEDDLRALYRAAGGTGGRGLIENVRVALTEHGELGPVLVNADQHHRGPVEVARAMHPDRRVRAREQREALAVTLARLQRRAELGEDVERAMNRALAAIDRHERVLAAAA